MNGFHTREVAEERLTKAVRTPCEKALGRNSRTPPAARGPHRSLSVRASLGPESPYPAPRPARSPQLQCHLKAIGRPSRIRSILRKAILLQERRHRPQGRVFGRQLRRALFPLTQERAPQMNSRRAYLRMLLAWYEKLLHDSDKGNKLDLDLPRLMAIAPFPKI